MSIKLAIENLQTLHRGLSGVKSAPTKYPGSISSARLPLVLVWLDDHEAQHITLGDTRKLIWVYRVDVYVEAITQGQGIDGPIQSCYTLMQTLAEAYVDPDNVRLYNSGGVDITLRMGEGDITCSGYQPLQYPPGEGGTWYHGFSFLVTVMENAS